MVDFDFIFCVGVFFFCWFVVVGVEGDKIFWCEGVGGEVYYEEGGVWLFCFVGDGGCCGGEEEFVKVLFVEGDVVLGVVVVVCVGVEFGVDGYLGGEVDDGDVDVVGDEGGDGVGDVVWVWGEEGVVDDEDFVGVVGGGVVMRKGMNG